MSERLWVVKSLVGLPPVLPLGGVTQPDQPGPTQTRNGRGHDPASPHERAGILKFLEGLLNELVGMTGFEPATP